MPAVDVYGIGNAMVDVVMPVEADFFNKVRFPRGRRLSITADQQNQLVSAAGIDESAVETALGGSVAQSLAVITQLNGKAAFSGRVADDDLARTFKQELDRSNVHFGSLPAAGGSTGRTLLIGAPDGSRSSAVYLGTAAEFNPADLSPAVLRQAKWLFIEGYLLENGQNSVDAILSAGKYVKRLPAAERPKICMSLGGRYLIKEHREALLQVLNDCDLVFGRLREVMLLTETDSSSQAFERLAKLVPNFVVTASGEGAYFSYCGEHGHEPACPVRPVDSSGAAEVFAGAFLFGITNGHTARQSVRGANYLAAQVLKQQGACLKGDVVSLWREGIKGA